MATQQETYVVVVEAETGQAEESFDGLAASVSDVGGATPQTDTDTRGLSGSTGFLTSRMLGAFTAGGLLGGVLGFVGNEITNVITQSGAGSRALLELGDRFNNLVEAGFDAGGGSTFLAAFNNELANLERLISSPSWDNFFNAILGVGNPGFGPTITIPGFTQPSGGGGAQPTSAAPTIQFNAPVYGMPDFQQAVAAAVQQANNTPRIRGFA